MTTNRNCPKCKSENTGTGYLCAACKTPHVAKPVDQASLDAANDRITASAMRKRVYLPAASGEEAQHEALALDAESRIAEAPTQDERERWQRTAEYHWGLA